METEATPVASNNSQPQKLTKKVIFVDVTEMIPCYVTNLREDYGDLEEMIATILNNPDGLPPLRGTKDRNGYVITEGHRRLMAGLVALERVGKTGKKILLPYYSEPVGYTDIDRLRDMFLMNQGKELTMLEQAKGIERLIDEYGMEPKDVSRLLHKSITYVQNCQKLVAAPQYLKDQISDNVIRPSLVLNLMKTMSIEQVQEVIRDTIDHVSSKPKKEQQSQLEFTGPDDVSTEPMNQIKKLDAEATAEENFVVPNGNGTHEIPSGEDERFRNSGEGGQMPRLKVHVTQKDINQTLEKFNSLAALKKMLKKYPDTTFNMREEKAEELKFLQLVIDGEVSGHDIWNRFFAISSEEELKEQLKA